MEQQIEVLPVRCRALSIPGIIKEIRLLLTVARRQKYGSPAHGMMLLLADRREQLLWDAGIALDSDTGVPDDCIRLIRSWELN